MVLETQKIRFKKSPVCVSELKPKWGHPQRPQRIEIETSCFGGPNFNGLNNYWGRRSMASMASMGYQATVASIFRNLFAEGEAVQSIRADSAPVGWSVCFFLQQVRESRSEIPGRIMSPRDETKPWLIEIGGTPEKGDFSCQCLLVPSSAFQLNSPVLSSFNNIRRCK